MRLEDLTCQHGGRIRSCAQCEEFRGKIAGYFVEKLQAASRYHAQWLSDQVAGRGTEAALQDFVARISALQVAVQLMGYGYVDILTMIAQAKTLAEAKRITAIGSLSSKTLAPMLVDQAVIDELDKACLDQNLYEKLAKSLEANEGNRGGTILREIRLP